MTIARARVDALIVGGGIMGCATALHLATGGMRVALLERDLLCAAASGVNAGTLAISIKRPELVPYALHGLEIWRGMSARLDRDIGFHVRGGLSLAFTEAEAATLEARTMARKAAGAPIELVGPLRAREIDPGITDRLVHASYCALDASANASVTGLAYRAALRRAGVDVREGASVKRIVDTNAGYEVHIGDASVSAPRLVLATGAWLENTAAMLGVTLPVHYRVNQVAVTERRRPIVKVVVSHALGALTLKQVENGTVLIGGGWQGRGDLESGTTMTDPSHLIGNLRLAQSAVPALAGTRLIRTWLGFEAHVPDLLPLVGPLPSRAGVFVIAGVRGGWTIGPYMAQLLGDVLLGRAPEMPLFDPGRLQAAPASAAGSHA